MKRPRSNPNNHNSIFNTQLNGDMRFFFANTTPQIVAIKWSIATSHCSCITSSSEGDPRLNFDSGGPIGCRKCNYSEAKGSCTGEIFVRLFCIEDFIIWNIAECAVDPMTGAISSGGG